MKFLVNTERVENLAWDQAITLEELATGEKPSLRALKSMLAAFMVDEDTGQYLDQAEAEGRLGKLKVREIRAVGDQFAGEVGDAMLPPPKGGS